MEHYSNGFAPETFFTIIIRLLMIGVLISVGIYTIFNGFNSKEDETYK